MLKKTILVKSDEINFTPAVNLNVHIVSYIHRKDRENVPTVVGLNDPNEMKMRHRATNALKRTANRANKHLTDCCHVNRFQRGEQLLIYNQTHLRWYLALFLAEHCPVNWMTQ